MRPITVIHYNLGPPRRTKFAGFDLDLTLIKTRSGELFSRRTDDWEWVGENVVPTLKKLSSTHLIVVITNSIKPSRVEQFKNIIMELDLPIILAMARYKENKKPSKRMFAAVEKVLKAEGVILEKAGSFYCGDAIGAPIASAKSGGPTAGAKSGEVNEGNEDVVFAKAIKVAFKSPTTVFGGIKAANSVTYKTDGQELILLIGYPGSGKTTFLEQYPPPPSYVIVHRDDYITQPKTLKATKLALESGKSAIVDATNPRLATRQEFYKLAEKFDLPVRLFWRRTTMELAMSRNEQREKHVPRIAYMIYMSKFDPPSIGEDPCVKDMIIV